MAKGSNAVAGWGALNIALNGLVKEGLIVGYKTARPEAGGSAGIEIMTAPGSDQAHVLSRVREILPDEFSTATVRTRDA